MDKLVSWGRVTTKPVNAARMIPGSARVISEDVNAQLPGFEIRTVRNSYNIPNFDMPIVYWGSDYLEEQYISIFNKYNVLPTGTSVTVAPTAQRGLRFTFTLGGNTDTADVFRDDNMSYLTTLQMMDTDWFTADKVRITCGTGNYATQLSTQINYGYGTLSGITAQGSLSLTKCMPPTDFKPNIVDMNAIININSRRYLMGFMVGTIVNATDQTVKHSYFTTDIESSVDFSGPTLQLVD